jgi:quinol monooxygenase YgiN
MPYAVAATYTVKAGEEAQVEAALIAMVESTRSEPACLVYEVHRSLEDPSVFFLYEQYADEAGFQAHLASEHFARQIKGEVWPRLEQRQRLIGEPLSGTPRA